jgi:RNA polymerase sigma factor (sigma-70 family)
VGVQSSLRPELKLDRTVAGSVPLRTMEQSIPVSQDLRDTTEDRFNRILREYGPALSRLAFGYEKVAGVREELTQEIALAIWQALPHFRGECSERTFVYRIAHNRGLTHACRRRPAPQPLDDLPQPLEPADPRPHPEDQAVTAHQHDRLRSAIRRLPLVYRQVVMLMLEELSHPEIAEVLGITESNVGVRLNRARKALKEALEERS